MPEPTRLLPTLHKAIDAFQTTPGRNGRFVQLTVVSDVFVAGDLHGNIENFKRILDLADLQKHRKRHLVLQELVHGPFRYPKTGGDQSHRLVDLLAALKCQYPARVHCLLGNHELSQWTNRSITKGNEDLNQLFRLGIETAYGGAADEIYAAYLKLFAALPVAIRTPNRVLLSHSLPVASRLDEWELSKLGEDDSDDAFKLGGSVHCVVWGRDTDQQTAERYLSKVEADLLVTGHIPQDEGFTVPNDRQLILDSKDEMGCACLIPTERPLTHQDLIAGIVRLRDKGELITKPT
jgi:hypothetical protein